MRLMLACVLLIAAGQANAITLCNLCTGYTISKRADGAVVIRCPGRAEPVFVMQNCRNPSVTRSGSSATITCR